MHLRTTSQRVSVSRADAEEFLDTFLLYLNTLQELERFLGADFVNKGKRPEE
ncbi:MAG: hypothetical protein RBU21_16180 [FCB group bacterium]|jgi:hypothetical protein|nr:hypothetical protein [FCB group bacterium]